MAETPRTDPASDLDLPLNAPKHVLTEITDDQQQQQKQQHQKQQQHAILTPETEQTEDAEDNSEDDYYSDDGRDELTAEDLRKAALAGTSISLLCSPSHASAPANAPPKPKLNQKPKVNVGASLDDQFSNLVRHAPAVSLNAYGAAAATSGKDTRDELRKRDKADRATKDQVMDNRTKVVLLKLSNRGKFYQFYDVPLSTGKEANVYHAVSYPPTPAAKEAMDEELARLRESLPPTKFKAAVANISPVLTEDQIDTSRPIHMAIKIYKTRILVFRDREKYVKGEWRFQNGYSKGNNLSMVKVWAEKEFRNLNRLYAAGIPSPKPNMLKSHVLLMDYVGDGSLGEHAPKLKEVDWSLPGMLKEGETVEFKIGLLYRTVISFIRVLFQTCQLVHGDLSEYNILFFRNQPWIIDVSQSTEHNHPESLYMLRLDIKNINNFFSRQGVDILPDRLVFSFVTSESLETFAALASVPVTVPEPAGQTVAPENLPAASCTTEDVGLPPQTPMHLDLLESVIVSRAERRAAGTLPPTDETDLDNAVFRQQYIPQTLDQVYDYERDAQQVKDGVVEKSELAYGHLLVNPGGSKPAVGNKSVEESQSGESGSGSDGEDNDGDEDSQSDWSDRPKGAPRGKRFQDKDDKKAHKLTVKAEKAEKRKTKMPKAEKKKLVKSSKKK